MIVDWIELGRGIGSFGGILYLIDYVEKRVVTSNWYARWTLSRGGHTTQGPRPIGPHPDYKPPKLHSLPCQLCGKNVTSPFGCEHPDAPTFEYGIQTVAPHVPTDQDPL